MAKGFQINPQGVRKVAAEIEREFAKNPVKVRLQADASGLEVPPATTVNTYNGPVVQIVGDHAQIAWNSHAVSQEQVRAEQVAAGFEDLADLVTRILANLPELGMDKEGASEAQATSETLLREFVKSEPSSTTVQHGVTMLKGLLAPIATGISNAVTQESADLARQMIKSLGEALGS